ncbi:hypothetical protein KFK09_000150 [Dendrobium nobile]|uniref:Auxin-responsive protein n=1 Tax=Dendrobium nobile TaxID=94219 RepID=A0A8T3CAG7_DENNO|nr:hypothetical protein KFK09_000150 [Dendrobium nobile]
MEELELGLSLSAKKATNASGDGGEERSWEWGKKNCRILTAKDFPMVTLLATPISSSSSVSSSSGSASNAGGGCGGDLGKKRNNDLVSPCIGGAGNQISQGLVGWPPVRAFRMNNMANQYKDSIPESNTSEQKKKIHNSNLKQKAMVSKEIKDNKNFDGSRFVKVKMDGDPIGRKVDLNAHESYKTLALALEIMFYKPTSSYGMKPLKLLDGSNEFALTYEDKDGDWMLVGDVPWSMFLDTVKRLRIMKITEASGQKLRLSFSQESAVLPIPT